MITSSDVITVQMSLSSEQAVGMAQKPPLAWPTSRHSSEVPKWNLAETEQGARCCGDLRYSRRVQVAQRLVEERLGPVKELSAAVWHELHRTRKGLGGLNLIHKLTGCRLHLQRDTSQVRLFGTAQCVARASALLDHLEELGVVISTGGQAPSGSRLPAWAGCFPVSRWCLGGVLVVSRWSVVSRWCLGGLLVVSWLCLGGVSVVSCWCLGGVSLVSRWCLVVVSLWCFGGVS